MAKTQILKVTKELKNQGIEVSNKEVIEFLNSKGVEVSSHMNNINDEEVAMVYKKFGSAPKASVGEKKEAPAKESPAKSAPAKEEKKAPEKEKAKKEEKAPEAAPPKKKHIIFATNNRNSSNKNNRFNNNRQVYRISDGKIEDPTKTVKKTFKHTEVASPDAFEGVKLPEKKEEEPTEVILETKEAEAPAKEVKEAQSPEAAAKGPKKIYGNVYDQMKERNAATQRRGVNNGIQEERNRGNRPYERGPQNRPQGRPSVQNDYRSAGANGGRPFGPGRNERPGSFEKGGAGRGGFGAAPSPEGSGKNGSQGRRSDVDRRRQSEAKRRKDAVLEASMEEKAGKKFNPHGFHKPAPAPKPKEEEIKVITIPETLTIRDLADHMKIQSSQIIKKLFLTGQVVTLNSEVTYEEAENIAADFDILCEHEKKVDVIAELLKENEEDDASVLKKRPPVVCVMGHVDHGKTSLLDKIRATRVTEKESGGITQAIGAYMVRAQGQKITFLDTPGHEAFTAMRMRGASSTDIAVLVVAADDGVMPQTVEAINHAKAAGVEIIVAVNKIDKPSANIERVKQELSEYELIPEDWGGSTVYVPVSAKTGEGIDQLLEMIILTADVMELKANPDRNARGLVLEARLDKGRGPVASILVQKGTLKVGDFIAVGACHGRVRAMLDENGKRIKDAGPSTPAEILGLDDVPEAGEIFVSPDSDKEAKNFADTFKAQQKNELLRETKTRMSLDDLYSQIKEGDLKEFNVIIKADVQGSVEALKTSLLKLSNEEVALKVIHSGVGAISESDVILASASNAIIIGFNVRADNMAKQSAEQEEVDIRLYKVIYQAIDDMENAMKGLLAPVFEEKIIGHVEIRQIFKASQIGNIAGSYVTDGIVERGCQVRITRDGELVHEGKLASLKRFKDDVKEVREGYECGLVFEDYNDVKELDQVECYKMVEVERK